MSAGKPVHLTESAQLALIEIFKAVADACDGGLCEDEDIREAYADAMKDEGILDLYGKLIEENPFNRLIK